MMITHVHRSRLSPSASYFRFFIFVFSSYVYIVVAVDLSCTPDTRSRSRANSVTVRYTQDAEYNDIFFFIYFSTVHSGGWFEKSQEILSIAMQIFLKLMLYLLYHSEKIVIIFDLCLPVCVRLTLTSSTARRMIVRRTTAANRAPKQFSVVQSFCSQMWIKTLLRFSRKFPAKMLSFHRSVCLTLSLWEKTEAYLPVALLDRAYKNNPKRSWSFLCVHMRQAAAV